MWNFKPVFSFSSLILISSVQLFSHVQLFVNPWTVGHQAPLSKEFSSKNSGVGYHFLLQGSSQARNRTWLSHTTGSLYPLSHQGSPVHEYMCMYWVLKITVDSDCSHEIKRHLLLGRKATTNLDRILKSRDVTLPTKVHIVKAIGFFSSHVWMWELNHKKGWVPKNWYF